MKKMLLFLCALLCSATNMGMNPQDPIYPLSIVYLNGNPLLCNGAGELAKYDNVHEQGYQRKTVSLDLPDKQKPAFLFKWPLLNEEIENKNCFYVLTDAGKLYRICNTTEKYPVLSNDLVVLNEVRWENESPEKLKIFSLDYLYFIGESGNFYSAKKKDNKEIIITEENSISLTSFTMHPITRRLEEKLNPFEGEQHIIVKDIDVHWVLSRGKLYSSNIYNERKEVYIENIENFGISNIFFGGDKYHIFIVYQNGDLYGIYLGSNKKGIYEAFKFNNWQGQIESIQLFISFCPFAVNQDTREVYELNRGYTQRKAVRLTDMYVARYQWTKEGHFAYPAEFRKRVFYFLMVANKYKRTQGCIPKVLQHEIIKLLWSLERPEGPLY